MELYEPLNKDIKYNFLCLCNLQPYFISIFLFFSYAANIINTEFVENLVNSNISNTPSNTINFNYIKIPYDLKDIIQYRSNNFINNIQYQMFINNELLFNFLKEWYIKNPDNLDKIIYISFSDKDNTDVVNLINLIKTSNFDDFKILDVNPKILSVILDHVYITNKK